MRHKNATLFFMTTALISPSIHAKPLNSSVPMAAEPTFNQLAQQCSSGVHPNTLQAVARVESKFNPYAIGVVKGNLKRQPTSLAEAVATTKSLHAKGKNFSMGLMQVNRYNLQAYGLNYETVFDPCKNINAGAKILKDCFDRAGGNGQTALQKAFSCYYSGNFKFGFKSDFKGQPPYVTKIILSAMDNSPHQKIGISGSLKTSSKRAASKINYAHLRQTSYVPQPSSSRADEYIPMPATAEPPQSEPVVATVANALPKPAAITKVSAAWDTFGEF